MHCILSTVHDPFFNLASEEVLLKHREEDYLLLYRNHTSIVVGKHQNTLAEINLPYVLEKDIRVARRISGGGTVFHDPGNLNFAFITTGKVGELVDYPKYTRPVISALGKMGLKVSLGKRNELLLGKHKISGTASHVYKNRVLHHGTLLFSSELDLLHAALNVKEGSFHDRAVRSVPSEVRNIGEQLETAIGVEEFEDRMLELLLGELKGSSIYQYSKADLKEINQLKEDKFSQWEWNFGYSPKYKLKKLIKFGGGEVALHLNVEKGIITEAAISGRFFGGMDIHGLEDVLLGTIHDPETLRHRLSGIWVGDYIDGLGNEEFLAGLF